MNQEKYSRLSPTTGQGENLGLQPAELSAYQGIE